MRKNPTVSGISSKRKNALAKAAHAIKNGGVAVIPTDTIYGIVGSALNRDAVERIYRLRKRNPKKPVIVLISSIDDLDEFGIKMSRAAELILGRVWPGKVSVIMPISSPASIKKFSYLHRGTKAIAFRLPKPAWLRAFVSETGPLAAPSANHEGKPPAQSIREAKKYFTKGVGIYVDAGKLEGAPSALIVVKNRKIKILRESGALRAIKAGRR